MQHKLSKFIALASFVLASTIALAQGTKVERIMVISDPHVLSSAKETSVTNSGKLDQNSFEIMDKAMENIIQAKPDLLLVCGDLTYNGEASSHTTAHNLLTTVKDAGIPVLVIPGNHDILNPNSIDEGHANLTAEQFATLYADMGYGSDVARDANSLSWAKSVSDKLAIIGLDANIYKAGSYYSDGCLRKSTLEWMKAQAAAFKSEGKMVIAMVHQQIMNHVEKDLGFVKVTQAQVAPTTILNNNYKQNPNELGDGVAYDDRDKSQDVSFSDVQKAFAESGIEFVLTGHFHIHHMAQAVVTKEDGTKSVVYDVSTGGLSSYPCLMRTLHVDADNNTLTYTSTMVEMPMGEIDLQKTAESAAATMDEQYPLISSATGMTCAQLIKSKLIQEPYELYDGTEVAQYNEKGTTYIGFPSLTYTRIFNNNAWQALYVPFASYYDDWSENFDIAEASDGNDTSLTFSMLKSRDEIKNNGVYIIRLKPGKPTGRYSISSSYKEGSLVYIEPIKDSDSEEIVRNYNLHGTYSGMTGTQMQGLYALGGGKLKSVATTVTSDAIFLKPMRWYLEIDNSSGARPTVIDINFDDEEVTAIELTDADIKADDEIYRLDGTLVKAGTTLPHGLYIINGKVTRR